jgi:hypothetical protein
MEETCCSEPFGCLQAAWLHTPKSDIFRWLHLMRHTFDFLVVMSRFLPDLWLNIMCYYTSYGARSINRAVFENRTSEWEKHTNWFFFVSLKAGMLISTQKSVVMSMVLGVPGSKKNFRVLGKGNVFWLIWSFLSSNWCSTSVVCQWSFVYEKNSKTHLERLKHKHGDIKGIKYNSSFGQNTET